MVRLSDYNKKIFGIVSILVCIFIILFIFYILFVSYNDDLVDVSSCFCGCSDCQAKVEGMLNDEVFKDAYCSGGSYDVGLVLSNGSVVWGEVG